MLGCFLGSVDTESVEEEIGDCGVFILCSWIDFGNLKHHVVGTARREHQLGKFDRTWFRRVFQLNRATIPAIEIDLQCLDASIRLPQFLVPRSSLLRFIRLFQF